MTNLVQFPGLGLSFELDRVAFSIGGMNIYWYGVCIAVGMCLALVFAFRHSVEFGVDADAMVDVILIGVVMGILCARLYYVALSPYQYHSLKDVLAIRDGGLAIYGGVLGAAIGVTVLCRVKRIKLPAMLDLVSLGFLIGQSIGRWGNFFNREAYGAETDAWLRMGLYDSFTGTTVYHHPTFLYESVWNALGFVILHFLSKKREYDGQIALGYAFWYGLGRFFIEGLRTDSLYIPGTAIRVSQLIAAVSCLTAAAVLVYFLLKPPAKPLFASRVLETDHVETDDEGGNEDA